MADNFDTIAAIATPPGHGGIGVIRISGPDSMRMGELLTSKSCAPRLAQFTKFKDEHGEVIDQGLVLFFPGPASYTGDDVIELHGHGGPVVMHKLLKRIIELGARQARPGEFTERAFLNGKIDLVQAEAVIDLVNSVSEQAAKSAMRSLNGEFSENITTVFEKLTSLRTYVEGAMDFAEEEIDFLSGDDISTRLEECLDAVDYVLTNAKKGRLLSDGIKAVIIGRPNVGKSSILNKLSQTSKAIVTETPGTTRDIIEENILLDGLQINISDTAGIRETNDAIENEGIRRALHECETADLILLITDVHSNGEDQLRDLIAKLPANTEKIKIINKIDLTGRHPEKISNDADIPEIYLSAKTAEGIDLLESEIKNIAMFEKNTESLFLARTRHVEALKKVSAHLDRAIFITSEKSGAELLAEELRKAQEHLAVITGEFVADDLLDEIFSKFCIGK